MAIKQDVNAPLIVTIGAVSALLLMVCVYGLQAWFFREEEAQLSRKWDEAGKTQFEDLRADQTRQIMTAGTSRGKEKYKTIPIEVAMQKIVDMGGKLPATQPAPK